MKKRLIVIFFMILLLIGCDIEEDVDFSTVTAENSIPNPITKVKKEEVVADKFQDSEDKDNDKLVKQGTARLKTLGTEEYRDVIIKKGASIELPHILGYSFQGYEDEQGTCYIDKNGKFTRDYYGTELLILWAKYLPNEYEIVMCHNNVPLEKFNIITCKYNSKIYDDLPFGREIEKNRKEDKDESYVVIGFADASGNQIISLEQEEVVFSDLEKYADHDGKILQLNIVSTDITYFWHNLSTRIISNNGFLKQELGNEKVSCDMFSVLEDIDLETLVKLGYKNAIVNLEFSFEADKAKPRVIILTEEASKKKELKKEAIIDTGKIKTDEVDGNIYSNRYIVPIEDISGDFYVYYNSDGVSGKEWNCTSITMEIHFIK